jgi:MoaA/NifB/PqqE/SkfB family radical SAM enzyme
MNLLSQFSKLTLTCSIDAIEEKFEYMRFPLKWKNTLKTLEVFKSMPNAILNANIVVSKLNILYLKETEDWLRSQGFTISYSYIQDGDPYWESHVFTEKQKQKVLEANEFSDHVRTLLYKQKLDPDLIEQGQIKLDWQDAVKGISLKEKMPEVYELFANG